MSLENQEEILQVKEAVNRLNDIACNTVLYHEDKEANSLNVLTRSYHLLIPDVPSPKAYLAAILANFFETKQFFGKVLDVVSKKAKEEN